MTAVFVVFGVVITCCLIVGLIISSYSRSVTKSQSILSDRDLLLLLNSEPDRILSAQQLARKTGMTKSQASSRLTSLVWKGLVSQMYSGIKSFYELRRPIEAQNLVELSDQPYISIEDLFKLFDHFDQKMDLQDICIATGLPFKVIEREMKYFEKEGIVHKMTKMSQDGISTNKIFYTLQESYKKRDSNDALRLREINNDLEMIYRNELRNEDFV